LLHSGTLTPGPRNITLDNKLDNFDPRRTYETATLSRCEENRQICNRHGASSSDPISQLHVYLNDNLRASHLIRRRSSGATCHPRHDHPHRTSRAGRDNDAVIYVWAKEEPGIRAYEGMIIPFGPFLRQYSARAAPFHVAGDRNVMRCGRHARGRSQRSVPRTEQSDCLEQENTIQSRSWAKMSLT